MFEFFLFEGILTITPSLSTSNNEDAMSAFNSLSISYTVDDRPYGSITISTSSEKAEKLRAAIFLSQSEV